MDDPENGKRGNPTSVLRLSRVRENSSARNLATPTFERMRARRQRSGPRQGFFGRGMKFLGYSATTIRRAELVGIGPPDTSRKKTGPRLKSNISPPIPKKNRHNCTRWGAGEPGDPFANRTPQRTQWRRRLTAMSRIHSRTAKQNVAAGAPSAVSTRPISRRPAPPGNGGLIFMTNDAATREREIRGRDSNGHREEGAEGKKRRIIISNAFQARLGQKENRPRGTKKTKLWGPKGPPPPARGSGPKPTFDHPSKEESMYARGGGGGGPSSQALPLVTGYAPDARPLRRGLCTIVDCS